MTSAQTFQGIGDRSSSRVLAPPGGGSSFSLFGGEPEPAPAPRGRQQQQQQQQQQQPAQQQQPQQRQQQDAGVARQEYAYAESVKGKEGLHDGRSSTRLHAPPGGQSSMAGILGGGGYGDPAPAPQQRRGQPPAQQQQQQYQQPQPGQRRDPNASSRGNGNIISWQ